MSKPLIFISHASNDAGLAKMVRNQLEEAMSHAVDVFASSNPGAIGSGDMWLDAITQTMNHARAHVVLITPRSLASHWVWFELGYYWRCLKLAEADEDAPNPRIYPLYSSGVPGIPEPLSHFQAKWLHDKEQMTWFFRTIYYQFADVIITHGTSGLKTFFPAGPAEQVVAYAHAHYTPDE